MPVVPQHADQPPAQPRIVLDHQRCIPPGIGVVWEASEKDLC